MPPGVRILKTLSSLLTCLLLLATATDGAAEVSRRVINDGQLVLEDIPPIPAGLPATLDRYQDTRATAMLDFADDGDGLFIRSQAQGLDQVLYLPRPDARRQLLTDHDEPVGEVARQRNGSLLAFRPVARAHKRVHPRCRLRRRFDRLPAS
jgi:hypothetical protein